MALPTTRVHVYLLVNCLVKCLSTLTAGKGEQGAKLSSLCWSPIPRRGPGTEGPHKKYLGNRQIHSTNAKYFLKRNVRK